MAANIKVEDVYPITNISWPNGEQIKVITDVHLKGYTPPGATFLDLISFLEGQPRIEQGVYPGDVERWLNLKK